MEDIEIVQFSTDWIEGYLDLAEKDEFTDPSAKTVSRELRKTRILGQMSTGSIKAHFIATHGGNVVASARAVMPPTCGDCGEDSAILALIVSPECRELDIRARLLKQVCDELDSQNVKWIEMAILDTWNEMQQFLEGNGFEPRETTAHLVLHRDVVIRKPTPLQNVTIRPIRLPEDRNKVIELFKNERMEDLPKECAPEPPWWEVEPWASFLDPEGFLVAEIENVGDLAGFADAWFYDEGSIEAEVGYVEVAKRFLGSGLRERLLSQAILWLRSKGAKDVRGSVHIGYRYEKDLFQRLGFEVERTATSWCRGTSI